MPGGNFGVPEVFAAGEHAAQQDGGVDGRDFRVPDPFAGIQVGPVVEEAAMRGHLLRQEASVAIARSRASVSETHPFCCPIQSAVRPKPVAAILATTPCIGRTYVAAVFDQAGLRVWPAPKRTESSLSPDPPETGHLPATEKVVTGGGAGRVCCSGAGDKGEGR